MPGSFNEINRNLEALGSRENEENRIQKKEYNPFEDPDFDVNKLNENEIKVGNQSIAKIPKLAGRFSEGVSEDGTPEIRFLADRITDEATGETRDIIVTIGIDISHWLKGMMAITDHYHEYFDLNGRLIYDPLKLRRKQEERKQTEEKQRQDKEKKEREEREAADTAAGKPTQPKTEERTVEDIRASLLEKEKLLEQKIQEAEAEKQKFRKFRQEGEQLLKQLEKQKEELQNIKEERLFSIEDKEFQHVELMHEILTRFGSTVDELAKRKPNNLMSLRQIRTINEILKELQYYFSTSNAADYLHLAEEPREDDLEHHPGTTYGEMALLLDAYMCTHSAFRYNKLYERNAADQDNDADDSTSTGPVADKETDE